MLAGPCRGQPLREPTQHIYRRCQLFFLYDWFGRGKLFECWAQKQSMSFRQFQVVWSILKPHADLQAFQFCSACAQSSEMGPRLGMFDLFQSVFFWPLEPLGTVPGLTDSQPCWLEAERLMWGQSNPGWRMRACSWTGRLGKLLWLESSSQALWHAPGHPRLNLFIQTFLEGSWGVLTIRMD